MTKNTHNNEKYTQEAILGLMLLYPELTIDLGGKCQLEWFQGHYRQAFNIVAGGGDSLNVSTAVDCLNLTDVVKWTEIEFRRSSVDQHIKTLEKIYLIRELKTLSLKLQGVQEPEEGFKFIENFQNKLAKQEKTEPIPIFLAAQELAAGLKRRSQNKGLQGISWGLQGLDQKTQGIHPGQLIVIAGQPSMGKTALAESIAETAASQGHGTLLFSLEMPRMMLMERGLSAASKVKLETIRAAKFDDRHWSRMTNGLKKISEFRLWIDDTASISTQEIQRKIKCLKRKEDVGLVVIDYLQIMDYDSRHEEQELGRITRHLKALAMDLNLSIIILSQLNRKSVNEKRKPQMSDLFGSGRIEANADVILFPWRESEHCELCRDNKVNEDHDPFKHKRKAEIIIGKQKQGERNISVQCAWLPEITRFVDLSNCKE